jgi:hypothetical protein
VVNEAEKGFVKGMIHRRARPAEVRGGVEELGFHLRLSTGKPLPNAVEKDMRRITRRGDCEANHRGGQTFGR